jgi:hypothetical protein
VQFRFLGTFLRGTVVTRTNVPRLLYELLHTLGLRLEQLFMVLLVLDSLSLRCDFGEISWRNVE